MNKQEFLKLVSIFAGAPDDFLSEAAGLLKEVEFEAGETIFEKGDYGDSMYIIVEGRVRVHDGDLTLDDLEERDVFGEMAALDPEPRSASVTVEAPTRLYSLERETLFSLLARRPEVGRAIIHVLNQRLRSSVQEMAEGFQYIQQFRRVTSAAVAVEAGIYDPHSLDEVAQRKDELGDLARVFQGMLVRVQSREQMLKQQVERLRIEIDLAHQARQVAAITETDYFQNLAGQVEALRGGRKKRKPKE